MYSVHVHVMLGTCTLYMDVNVAALYTVHIIVQHVHAVIIQVYSCWFVYPINLNSKEIVISK